MRHCTDAEQGGKAGPSSMRIMKKSMQETNLRRLLSIFFVVMIFVAGAARVGLRGEFVQFSKTTRRFITNGQTSAAPHSYAFVWNVLSSGLELLSSVVCLDAGITIGAGDGDCPHHSWGKGRIPKAKGTSWSAIVLFPAKVSATVNGWIPPTTTGSVTMSPHTLEQNTNLSNPDQQRKYGRRDLPTCEAAEKWAHQAFRLQQSGGKTHPGGAQELIDTSKGALLNIPPRLQWLNDNGYCGETTIQSFLLYFGGYASQDVIRKSVGGELVTQNLKKAIHNFAFNTDKWRGGNDSRNLLVWMKSHLQQGHPVTGLVYITHMNHAYHILPFIGYESSDSSTYHDDDVIIYNPLLGNNINTIRQRFGGTVAAKEQCCHEYCICKERMYAIAITGNKDATNATLRARLEISSNDDEPNVSDGRAAATFNGILHIYGLTVGEKYSILRYDDYRNVPACNFLSSKVSSQTDFTAIDTVHTFNDRFPSDGVAIYRVVKARKQ